MTAGLASILGFVWTANEGFTLNRPVFCLAILLIFGLLFLTASTVYQGWRLYDCQFRNPRFCGIQRNDEYQTQYVFLLDSNHPLFPGMLLEVHRYRDGVEGLVGVLEVIEQNVKQQYQAIPLWLSPGHLRDLRTSQLSITDITVRPFISRRVLDKTMLEVTGAGND